MTMKTRLANIDVFLPICATVLAITFVLFMNHQHQIEAMKPKPVREYRMLSNGYKIGVEIRRENHSGWNQPKEDVVMLRWTNSDGTMGHGWFDIKDLEQVK